MPRLTTHCLFPRLPWCLHLLFSLALLAQPVPAKLTLVTSEYPPFEYTENGVARGLSVEIVQAVFRQMGQPIEIKAFPWKRALFMIQGGSADAAFTTNRTSEREAYGVFPKESLLSGTISFFSLSDASYRYTGDLASLSHCRVGTDRGSSYGDVFDEAVRSGQLRIIESDTPDISLRALITKRVDLYLVDDYVAWHLARKNGVTSRIRRLTPPFAATVPAYLMFTRKKDLSKVMARFDATLAELKRNGTIDRIIRKYTE